ncbi:MAG: Radical domain protein [Bacillales bacterium]|jgi:MoaA/NifB/PqqE/SkfB family radical SAM enzyme|nr:Radical domain protein [Bacillales bacterium]
MLNKKMILKLILNRKAISNFIKIHKKFSQSRSYKIKNAMKCGLNVIKHDRLVLHDGHILVNSFIPPITSLAFLNIAEKVPGEGSEFFENHVQGKRLAPISSYIAVTNKCMYGCWHCSANRFVTNEKENNQSDFNTEQLKEVIAKLQNLGVGIIGFTGGEPLLRKDLEEVISTITNKSITLLFTTGFHLSYERAVKLRESGLFGIAISLDSIYPEKHDELRGFVGAFDHAITAIRNAKKAGLYTMSQTVCRREMMETGEILELAKFLKTENIDEMRILEPLPCGKLSNSNSGAVLSSKEQTGLKNLHITLNHNKVFPKASVFPYFESDDQFGCGAGVQHSYVDTKGNFGSCDFLSKTYGNVLTENVHELWKKTNKDMGGPKSSCYAKCGSNCGSKLPKFYRLLGGFE